MRFFRSSDKENDVAEEPTPRGLSNESSTCYLNSLLQVLFHIHPFRKLVFNLTQQTQEEVRTQIYLLEILKTRQSGMTILFHSLFTLSMGLTSDQRHAPLNTNGSFKKEIIRCCLFIIYCILMVCVVENHSIGSATMAIYRSTEWVGGWRDGHNYQTHKSFRVSWKLGYHSCCL